MVAFIEMDGADKARDIDERAEEEYNLIKGNLLYNGRRELQESFNKRNKTAEKNVTQLESIIVTKKV
ncbi:V-type proton ATPase subunit E 2-like [Nilaparvata lugens]|uniref:V-type proton ATPase subunit E 2-like n=1 Tax=Nilaparvata lugens TaxID=108931 RepID=UPI00193E700A|nr:V-type proton ATPase subunit E 2-like [Nilaparvata lugens]